MKFFGWRMVFTGLTVEFTVIGFLFYSFPVIWPYLISELGMTESQLGMVSAFYFMPVAILAIVIGRALDKYSVKNFMMIGAVIYAIGLFSLSFINSYWSLLTIYLTILALGSIMMGNLAVAKLISNWFDKNAGRALGIAAVGISFSGVVLPLVVDPLLDLVGWRNVYVIFASVILFIILPLIFFTVIDDPKTVNQVKDGIKTHKEEEPLPQEITAKDLLSNFFGGLFIYMDRPFAVGDWIRSPDRELEGVVEKIGWRVTVIRTFDKRPLYVPNSVFSSFLIRVNLYLWVPQFIAPALKSGRGFASAKIDLPMAKTREVRRMRLSLFFM